jgi:GlpG protein
MLKIGHLDNELDARTFGDYLYVQGIETQVDPASKGGWEIWVINEQQVAQAEALLARFKEKPDDPEFTRKASGADALRKEEERRDARAASVDLRRRWRILPAGLPSTTALVLIVFSVVATVLFYTGNTRVQQALSITPFSFSAAGPVFDRALPEIRQGQVWRLVTPIFLHFGILHILFNMMWMRDLGSMVERRENAVFFIGFVIAAAVCSNLGQFLVSGPAFGGMSGVNYALFGYAWMRSKFDPFSGYAMHKSVVFTMIAWFVLCYLGVLGSVANTAHAVGLGLGIAWGFLHGAMRSKT